MLTGWFRGSIRPCWIWRIHSTLDLAYLGANVVVCLLLRFLVLLLPGDQCKQRE